MAVSGTLAATVHRLEASQSDDNGSTTKYSVRMVVGDTEHDTAYVPAGQDIDESLKYNVDGMAESAEVTIEVLRQGHSKPIMSNKLQLHEFMQGFQNKTLDFTSGTVSSAATMHLIFSADWTPSKQKATTLTRAETHRPWFMRASYYYDATKNVYDYTTSFRIVKPFARLGEGTVNTVLATVMGKTLYDVDQSLVTPMLNKMDNKVDATISVAFTKLYQGQQMAVRTKNKAVHGVSMVARKTGSTAVRATSYTVHKVIAVPGTVLGVVSGVADYAGSQVVHASSSTCKTVRGVTYSVASRIPILESKIRA